MARPAPLDLIFPRPVLVTLAGEPFRASELTLGDLATLQSWLRQAAGHPMEAIPPARSDPEPGTRRARLLAAWRAQKAWPPLLGSDDDAALLDSPEGRAVFLVLCLGRHDPAFDAERASALAARLAEAEWAALRRVAYGLPPWRELAAELDPAWAEDQAAAAGDPDWAAVVCAAVASAGLDYAAIERWTPTQLRLFASGGVLGEYRAAMRPGESKEAFEARMVATFSDAGPVSPPGGGSPPG